MYLVFDVYNLHLFCVSLLKQGLELDDFISGPRELLLKFVEENYPLPEKPEPLEGIYAILYNCLHRLF